MQVAALAPPPGNETGKIFYGHERPTSANPSGGFLQRDNVFIRFCCFILGSFIAFHLHDLAKRLEQVDSRDEEFHSIPSGQAVCVLFMVPAWGARNAKGLVTEVENDFVIRRGGELFVCLKEKATFGKITDHAKDRPVLVQKNGLNLGRITKGAGDVHVLKVWNRPDVEMQLPGARDQREFLGRAVLEHVRFFHEEVLQQFRRHDGIKNAGVLALRKLHRRAFMQEYEIVKIVLGLDVLVGEFHEALDRGAFA